LCQARQIQQYKVARDSYREVPVVTTVPDVVVGHAKLPPHIVQHVDKMLTQAKRAVSDYLRNEHHFDYSHAAGNQHHHHHHHHCNCSDSEEDIDQSPPSTLSESCYRPVPVQGLLQQDLYSLRTHLTPVMPPHERLCQERQLQQYEVGRDNYREVVTPVPDVVVGHAKLPSRIVQHVDKMLMQANRAVSDYLRNEHHFDYSHATGNQQQHHHCNCVAPGGRTCTLLYAVDASRRNNDNHHGKILSFLDHTINPSSHQHSVIGLSALNSNSIDERKIVEGHSLDESRCSLLEEPGSFLTDNNVEHCNVVSQYGQYTEHLGSFTTTDQNNTTSAQLNVSTITPAKRVGISETSTLKHTVDYENPIDQLSPLPYFVPPPPPPVPLLQRPTTPSGFDGNAAPLPMDRLLPLASDFDHDDSIFDYFCEQLNSKDLKKLHAQ
jgi:NCAIR mutase (PurE)-related protein